MRRIALCLALTLSAVSNAAGSIDLQLDFKALNLEAFQRSLKDSSDDIERVVHVRARPFRTTTPWTLDEKIPLEFVEKKGRAPSAELDWKKSMPVSDSGLYEVLLSLPSKKGKFLTQYLLARTREDGRAAKAGLYGVNGFEVRNDETSAWPEPGRPTKIAVACDFRASVEALKALRADGDDFIYGEKDAVTFDVVVQDKSTGEELRRLQVGRAGIKGAKAFALAMPCTELTGREGQAIAVQVSTATMKGKLMVARGEDVAWVESSMQRSPLVTVKLELALGSADQAVAKGTTKPAVPAVDQQQAPQEAAKPAPAAVAAPPPTDPAPQVAAPAAGSATPQPSAVSNSPFGSRKRHMSACERSCERARKACFCQASDAACPGKCDAALAECTKGCGP